MVRANFGLKFFLVTTLFLFIFSCAGIDTQKPDIVSTKKVNGTISNAEVRQIVVDQPFLISGDYFRERPTPKDTIDIKGVFSKSKNIEERVAKLEKKLEQNQSPNTQHMQMTMGAMNTNMQKKNMHMGPLTKIGIIMFDEITYLKDALSQNLNNLSPSYNFLFYPEAQLKELFSPTNCLKEKDLRCISHNLSLYPGIRFLIIVNKAHVKPNFPQKMSLEIKIVDTGLSYTYILTDTLKEFKNEKEFKLYLKNISEEILKFADKKRTIMPWYSKIFSVKNDKYYLNAGKLSGLRPGDKLYVVEYEEPILAPTKVPVAWSPGKTLGKLKVIHLLGEDVSECVKVEGDMNFKVGDIVIK